MKFKEQDKLLLTIYNILFREFGPRHWWPGDTKLEIIIGAILTQNTAWGNVEKAIANLKKKNLLKTQDLNKISRKALARLIRPAGYYNIKSQRIKNFLDYLNKNYQGSIKKLFKATVLKVRGELLTINGIGQETADSILLYAGEKPVFVVDAYTKRIFLRHGIIKKNADYKEIQTLFLENLPRSVNIYKEFHALLVELGKRYCKAIKPLCKECPIRRIRKNG